MRNISTILAQIKKLVPTSSKVFHAQLDSVASSIAFSAPELMDIRWEQLSSVLSCNIELPLRNEWEVEIISIFTSKSREEVQETFGDNHVKPI